MPGGASTAGLGPWLLAALPVVVLVVLVVRAEWSTGVTALLATLTAILIGTAAFGAGPGVLAVGAGKGVWTGIWILYVIWPALLLYEVAAEAGLDHLGDVFSSVLPRGVENVLLVAWVFPSFVQGVAGFGTPIAVAAPLLVSMGLRPVRAVVLPLIGYHWSVTFGSMGSSFYMGALTAGLSPAATDAYAAEAALLLGVNMLVAGALVAFLHEGLDGLRRGARMIVVVGAVMFVVLNLVVRIEPSIGSLAAGAAGLAAAWLLRLATRRADVHTADADGQAPVRAPVRDSTTSSVGADEPEAQTTDRSGVADAAGGPSAGRLRDAVRILVPYGVLLVSVMAVFLPAPTRRFATSELLIGPSFPATETALGVSNAAVDVYTPIALLGHPGTYILLSVLVGIVYYRSSGLWPDTPMRPVLSRWMRKALGSSLSVVALTTLATIMVDTGMVRTVANGAATVTGSLYPLISPLVGSLGSFTTGSTTTSNALFAALQRDVAMLLEVSPPHLVAAQTVGGNVGNSMAPVVIVIGATAIGIQDREQQIFREVVGPGLMLAGVTAVLTLLLVSVG